MQMISDELKTRYGGKVYKLSLQSGCTCPNRDGTKGVGGCSFCSEGGSGDFAAPLLPIPEQIRIAREKVEAKFPKGSTKRLYIAYFQSFTNTYGAPERLEALFRQAMEPDEILGISIGTRPDCQPEEMVQLLALLIRVMPVWVELGLQTVLEQSAVLFNRVYGLDEFEAAYRRLKAAGLYTVLHMIVGLPGETEEDILETARFIGALDPHPDGIKIQLLHVLRGTRLAEQYAQEPFHILTLEEYCDLVVKILRILPEDITIHRLTGDGPKRLLIEPKWSGDKKRVLNTMRACLREAGLES